MGEHALKAESPRWKFQISFFLPYLGEISLRNIEYFLAICRHLYLRLKHSKMVLNLKVIFRS